MHLVVIISFSEWPYPWQLHTDVGNGRWNGRQLPLAILAASHGTFSERKVHVERVHKQCKFTCVPLCECKEKKVTRGWKDIAAF